MKHLPASTAQDPIDNSKGVRSNDQTSAANGEAEQSNESMGRELQLYGSELILRASDNCTLVAFAGIALQEIRGRTELAHNIGSSLFLLAVLMCAVVHFSIGNSYLSRSRRLLKSRPPKRAIVSGFFMTIACLAGLFQFFCIITGLMLVLPADPLPFLEPFVDLFR